MLISRNDSSLRKSHWCRLNGCIRWLDAVLAELVDSSSILHDPLAASHILEDSYLRSRRSPPYQHVVAIESHIHSTNKGGKKSSNKSGENKHKQQKYTNKLEADTAFPFRVYV